MPTDETLKKLAEIIKNDSGKNELVHQIDHLSQDLSKTNPPDTDYVQINYPLLYQAMSALSPDLNTTVNQQALEDIKHHLTNLQEIIVETPIDYPEIGLWVRTTVNPYALTTLRESDNEPLAGLKLSYQGNYEDLSLDKIIKDKVYA